MSDKKKTLLGQVISDRMNKTIIVIVNRKVKHPLYGKFITRSTKYHVHDESNQCKLGDTVEITETRPYSKTKMWQLTSVLNSME